MIPDQEQNSSNDATADPVTTLLDQYDEELIAWRELDHEARPRYEALRTGVEAAVRAGLRAAGSLSPGDVRVWVDPVTLGLRAQRIDIPRPEIDGPFEITFPDGARPTLADVLDEIARRQFARETPRSAPTVHTEAGRRLLSGSAIRVSRVEVAVGSALVDCIDRDPELSVEEITEALLGEAIRQARRLRTGQATTAGREDPRA